MARPYVRSIQPYDAKEIFGNLSQTNHYQVSFSGLNSTIVDHLRSKYGILNADSFMSRKGGLLCSEASLPPTGLATGELKNDFMGIVQPYAHTRMYPEVDFTFYVDKDYTNLKVFEGWIDYIVSGSAGEIDELSKNYYHRLRYPDEYKMETMFISKFEKDYARQLDYQFVNAFPKSVSVSQVAYGSADLLRVTVQFVYDRYIVNPKGRLRENAPSKYIEQSQAETNKQQSLVPETGPEQRNILGNSQSELNELQRSAYLDSTKGRVFGRSQSARDLDESYEVTRNSRGEEI